ncbi:MAG: DNA-directed RNA polymerase subunit beta' [Candidatus Sumerlaeia bacterium]|nr:DNA-directed RNA polymerase subunit beta' [Candidatus Sumerlaeia bacterium]
MDLSDIDPVARISLASADKILSWSRRHCRQVDRTGVCACGKSGAEIADCPFGEVKKPETINYRSFKPEKDGLFCERIFGPVKDWECACGKYKRIKYKGIICDRCGVEVTESKVRRVRMGHIKLAAPVSHIWFYKGTSSRISNLLDISVRDLGKVLYFQDYIVVEAGDSPLKEKQILTEEEARKYREVYGDKVKIMIGAEAIKELLKKTDIDELSARLQVEMREATSAQKRQRVIKRLKVVEAFKGSGNRPEWMVLDILPVIPPDLRPLVHLDGGRFATSDLNDLYRRVINRNNRLKRLIELRAPDVILRNEKRMLQEAVDALFDNSRRSRPTKGHNNRPLKSLSDMLKGKQGRFRQNLLGKRVDYSGRSVIVVGPELKFNQCGLPKKMALELFDPFIIHELQKRGYCNTIKSAKKMMEREEPVVYDILDEIIADHPVMLNRAPTLHRLGVQAFMPKLVEGKAIRLHPLACAAFNADFDGDQMAVHVPLSVEAKMEAKLLMLAENNILSPASGRPIATPSQDVVLGCYYLTKMRRGAKGEGMAFASPEEVQLAQALGHVDLHAEVSVRVGSGRVVKTTPGRVIFSKVLPPEIDYFGGEHDFCNELMTKKQLGAIVALAHKIAGPIKTARMLDSMKELGFDYAKRGGISICVDHMIVPAEKPGILDRAKRDVRRVEQDYAKGVITNGERYNRVIDIWTHATDSVGGQLMKELKSSYDGFNPIYMMAFSGARGSEQQIRQLAGMRGLMQKPTKKLTGGIGEIIESPIMSNFREGLTVVEYFISTHGARKGLADTALKTSDAGYLTRRLVDVAQDLIVNEEDCGTVNGIDVEAIKEITSQGQRVLESLSDRIEGRVCAQAVVHPHTGKTICDRNQLIDENIAREIEDAGIEEVKIRSVLTCETRRGCCAKCYGRNLSTGQQIELGEAVGVIAAQSIGEPGTQLTLRTFHIGGVASRQLEGWYEASQEGVIKYKGNLRTVQREDGLFVVVNRTGKIIVEDDDGNELQTLPLIPYGAVIHVPDGGRVKPGDHFVEWQPHLTPIVAEVEGKVKFIDLKPGATLREELDITTEVKQRIVTEHKEELHPQIQITDDKGDIIATYALSSGTILSQGLASGQRVNPGDVLARIPRAKARSKDITGGLPRVDELFEARKPKDAAVIADIDGLVHFKGISKGIRKIAIVADNGEEETYSIPLSRHLTVRDGERVQAGDQLTDGSISPHDVLRVKGEKAVQEFLLAEIQEVYRLQGVHINDKHIECIIRQMLKKVIVTEPGDTQFLYGQQVDRAVFVEENQRIIEKGGQPATAEPKLLGLTKASLETESFISAASFQETTRVLTDAAIRGRCDHLRGLKENVIMGLLIPAGTGLPVNRTLQVESTDPRPTPPESGIEQFDTAIV